MTLVFALACTVPALAYADDEDSESETTLLASEAPAVSYEPDEDDGSFAADESDADDVPEVPDPDLAAPEAEGASASSSAASSQASQGAAAAEESKPADGAKVEDGGKASEGGASSDASGASSGTSSDADAKTDAKADSKPGDPAGSSAAEGKDAASEESQSASSEGPKAETGEEPQPEAEEGQAPKPDPQWQRLWGNSHFDTMVEVSKAGWADAVGDTVVLATSAGYWDALSAAGVAGLENAPVLLVEPNALPAQAKAELVRIKPAKIIVSGGPLAISDAVVAAAEQACGAKATRQFGQTETGTAARIGAASAGKWSDTAIVATNSSYYDALSAAPLSYHLHMPIFLSEGAASISDETVSAMKTSGVKKFIVVGGSLAVSDAVVNKLKGAGFTLVERIWGNDHYDTSAAIATWGIAHGMSANHMGVATANSYYDALTGAALCGSKCGVLVLADDPKRLAIDESYFANYESVETGYVFGGNLAVSAATWEYLQRGPGASALDPWAGALGNGRVYLVAAMADQGFVIDVPGGRATEGAQIHLWQNHRGQPQKFVARALEGGYFALQALSTGLYLTDEGGKLVQRKKAEGEAAATQSWAITPAVAGLSIANQASGKAIQTAAKPESGQQLSTAAPAKSTSQGFAFSGVEIIQNGYYTIGNASGLNLALSGTWYANGANIDLRAANDSLQQRFYIERKGDYYQIINAWSRKALDVADGKTDQGTNVRQYDMNGTDAQLWGVGVDADGYLVFKGKGSGKNLQAAGNGTAEGTNVQIWPDAEGTGQQWRLNTAAAYVISGDTALDARISSIVTENGGDLRRCFDWMLRFDQVQQLDISWLPNGIVDNATISRLSWQVLNGGKADCFGNGALFCLLARGCGYQANFRVGAVPSAGGGQALHGWTEITINGIAYVCDPNLRKSFPNYNWYMQTYASAPVAYIF